jgi:hypothetical protein
MISTVALPVFTMLAGAIFLDFLFNGGEATSACIKAVGTIFHGHPKTHVEEYKDDKMGMIKELKDEIDSLYDDLAYADEDYEKSVLTKRIETKKELLNKILSDGK